MQILENSQEVRKQKYCQQKDHRLAFRVELGQTSANGINVHFTCMKCGAVGLHTLYPEELDWETVDGVELCSYNIGDTVEVHGDGEKQWQKAEILRCARINEDGVADGFCVEIKSGRGKGNRGNYDVQHMRKAV